MQAEHRCGPGWGCTEIPHAVNFPAAGGSKAQTQKLLEFPGQLLLLLDSHPFNTPRFVLLTTARNKLSRKDEWLPERFPAQLQEGAWSTPWRRAEETACAAWSAAGIGEGVNRQYLRSALNDRSRYQGGRLLRRQQRHQRGGAASAPHHRTEA